MTDIDGPEAIEASQRRWREGRKVLDASRHDLSRWAARTLYADYPRVAATDLLTRLEWTQPGPVALEHRAELLPAGRGE